MTDRKATRGRSTRSIYVVVSLTFVWRTVVAFTPVTSWRGTTGTGAHSFTPNRARSLHQEADIKLSLGQADDYDIFKADASNLSSEDPFRIEFVRSADFEGSCLVDDMNCQLNLEIRSNAPFVNMIRGSAPYIANHRDETSVFSLPGDIVERENFSRVMDDIALAWLLGLKIVLVVGSSGTSESYSHEYHNSLQAVDQKLIRSMEEELGFIRFEIERQMNRCLRHNTIMAPQDKDSAALNGNVVSGNFYIAERFGTVRGVDYKSTGYPKTVQVEKIQRILENNDIVLLTPVGTSMKGDTVSVNAQHLAAFIAVGLRASKLIYFSNSEGVILRSERNQQHLQDVPLSCAKALVEYHNVQVHEAGFASFDKARQNLGPSAVEHLLHLGWSSWALEKGVKRAHIVDPKDGALLEELFTATDGANTCIRHDDERSGFEAEFDDIFNVFPQFTEPSGTIQ